MKIKQQHIIQLKIITILLYIQSKSPPLQNQVGTASPSAQGKLTLFDPLTNNILNNDIEATLQLIYRVKNRDTGTIVADRRPLLTPEDICLHQYPHGQRTRAIMRQLQNVR